MLSLLLVPSLVEGDLFGERELEREELDGDRDEELLEDDLGDFEQCRFEQ